MAYIENAFAWNCRFHVISTDTFWHTSDWNDLRNCIGRINYEIAIFYISYCIEIRIILYFGPKKCLKESKITCWVASKRQVWSTFFLFEIYDDVSKLLTQKYNYFNSIHFFIETYSQLGSLAGLLMPAIKHNTTFCYVLLCYA